MGKRLGTFATGSLQVQFITMTTLWLLMVVLVSARSVYGQVVTTAAQGADNCPDMAQLMATLQRILAAQNQLLEEQQLLLKNAGIAKNETVTKTSPATTTPLTVDQTTLADTAARLEKLQRDVQAIRDNYNSLSASYQSLQNRVATIENSGGGGAVTPRPVDCAEIYKCGDHTDGVYTIYMTCSQRPVQVYCDMTTDGGGWTVFQRRQDGSVDFYLNWTDYRTGFGNLAGEFWLGNDYLNLLTTGKRQHMRVDLQDFNNVTRYAEYDNFKVLSAGDKYKLSSLGTYSGTAGDSMRRRALGMKFSTLDQDNDLDGGSCAAKYKGAWWYASCHYSNLNGKYQRPGGFTYAEGINWYTFRGDRTSMKFTEMKLRPFDF